MNSAPHKLSGAYYTPEDVAASLVRWAVHRDSDRLLDPACGDGRFICAHRPSVGVEQNPTAARQAMERAPWALVHEGDFFAWTSHTFERFECAAGNPPFIRYQTFKGATRALALRVCSALGIHFTGLTSSWAPFLVATASLLKPGGRMAFVVPAEIGHAPYASPLMEYLVARFGKVQIIAIREKLFPDLSEDCWLLYAEGFGSRTEEIRLSVLDRFQPSGRPPLEYLPIKVDEWRKLARRRLRAYLLPREAREFYFVVTSNPETRRLGDYADIGIGYVSGANDFFHLRPSDARRWDIPEQYVSPTVRSGRALPPSRLTASDVAVWRHNDEPILLLRLPRKGKLPAGVTRYLETDAGMEARRAYKCRNRHPWYSVPDVQFPDYFLTYMSGRVPSLVFNEAGCTCTNSIHSVRLRNPASGQELLSAWRSPMVQLSCELEGHPLGGGMLKLEPREAQQVIIPGTTLAHDKLELIKAGLNEMQRWRHYAVEA